MNHPPEPLHRLARAAGTAFLVLWLATAAASAPQIVDPSAIRRTTADPVLIQRAEQLAALARSGATDELGRQLRSAAGDAALGALAREWLLDRGLHEAARLTPTDGLRATVEALASRRPEVFVRADPDHGHHAVPLFDPGATARFVLRGWTRAQSRERAAAAVQTNQLWPIERFAQDSGAAELDPVRSGILDAFRAASPERLARYRSAVSGALDRGERIDELAALVAERLGDAELHRQVLEYAEPLVALGAVQRTRTVFGDTAALDILNAASRRPELASAAILEIGGCAERSPNARAQLLASIDDPALAASAAAALAALHDPAVADQLGRRLRAETQEALRRPLVLALKLDGSSAARAELERFAKTRSGSPELQKEVRAWLAQ